MWRLLCRNQISSTVPGFNCVFYSWIGNPEKSFSVAALDMGKTFWMLPPPRQSIDRIIFGRLKNKKKHILSHACRPHYRNFLPYAGCFMYFSSCEISFTRITRPVAGFSAKVENSFIPRVIISSTILYSLFLWLIYEDLFNLYFLLHIFIYLFQSFTLHGHNTWS